MDAQAATLHRNEDIAGVDVLAATGPNGTSGVASVAAEFPVQSWDRYEVLSIIGRGGMGAVYKARDRRLDRMVALKFLRVDDANLLARFQREASTQARLDHPNICRVFEVGEVERKPYIAMQFVDGKTIDQAAPSLSLFEKVVLIKQVALALHEAHRLGIIHRDVKPSNIMVIRKEDGTHQPLVMDFGIALEARENRGLTETGAVMGTPAYMSPEQARGGSRGVDRRADVYSLGATLYELLTGKAPFGGTEVVDVLLAVLNEEPRPPRSIASDVPRDLETIVLKCLAKEVGQRYDSARALAEDLQRYIDGEPILGKRASLSLRLRRQYRKHRALFALGMSALVVIGTLVGIGIRERVRSQKQAMLAQRLGQEITQMEWLLRSARQLPLHDLGREKSIVRKRMQQLQTELAEYGSLGRGLAHYALGRGHLALHEYPQALIELRLAQSEGNQSADVHHALGLVLGKHYEQAMYEARLAGGGEWADKQIKDLEPKFLAPALQSLQKSRELVSDTPGYLDALISYYQRDFDTAQRLAAAAVTASPWLYEGLKLQGDMQLQKALKARDSGKDDEAKQAFSAAVRHYQDAARIGQSDAEVYEGLAEAWVRQVEMAALRDLPTEAAYAAAIESSDKITAVEPNSTVGSLKKAYAALMAMAMTQAGLATSDRVRRCQTEAQLVLAREPENPYACDVAAACNTMEAQSVPENSGQRDVLYQRSMALLERALERTPHFLWGHHDLAIVYLEYAFYLEKTGRDPTEYLEKAHDYEARALALDPGFTNGIQSYIFTLSSQIRISRSTAEIEKHLREAEKLYAKCQQQTSSLRQCELNLVHVLTHAANGLAKFGESPERHFQRARSLVAAAYGRGESSLELEQLASLAVLFEAKYQIALKRDPLALLRELRVKLDRCFSIEKHDSKCKTIEAQMDLIEAEWAEQTGKSPIPMLQNALGTATDATNQPDAHPDAWQTLGESYLRLARQAKEPKRSEYVLAGHTALARAFAVNPNHVAGRATEGELFLLAAEGAQGAKRKELAQSAQSALEKSASLDPLVAARLAPLRKRAGELLGPM